MGAFSVALSLSHVLIDEVQVSFALKIFLWLFADLIPLYVAQKSSSVIFGGGYLVDLGGGLGSMFLQIQLFG